MCDYRQRIKEKGFFNCDANHDISVPINAHMHTLPESDDTCEVSELPEGQRILRVGEQGFLYQDEENGRMDSCRVFTCMVCGLQALGVFV